MVRSKMVVLILTKMRGRMIIISLMMIMKIMIVRMMISMMRMTRMNDDDDDDDDDVNKIIVLIMLMRVMKLLMTRIEFLSYKNLYSHHNDHQILFNYQDGSTPLMVACLNGFLMIVRTLMKNGADIQLMNMVREEVVIFIVIIAVVFVYCCEQQMLLNSE